jgi:PKD repeat protein
MAKRFRSAGALTVFAVLAAACTMHKAETPALSGPSELSLSLSVLAIPDTISQDGGSQSSIKVTALGPNGRPVAALPLRIDTRVNGVPQDFGTLSARTVVTNSDGVATVVFTAPPSPASGIFGQCGSLVGTCVEVVATATGTAFEASRSQSVQIRLVPPGVILPPAATPAPCFTISPTAPTANTSIQFTAGTLVNNVCGAAAADIVSFQWTFGDGTTGSGRTLNHTYTVANTFNVTLTETSDRGLSATVTQQVSMGSATVPTASFNFSPASPGVQEPVFFNAANSTAGVGHTIGSYRWTFGDGGTGSGVTVSHTYTAAGAYTVTMTVTDEAGQTATSSQSVSVGLSTPGPTSNFTFSPTLPVINQVITFDASTSSTSQGQTITNLAWNFGDGSPIVNTSARTITHGYLAAGTYTVNLVVTDSANRVASRSQTVIVGGGGDPTNPQANFTVTPNPVLVNQEASFDGSASTRGSTNAAIIRYDWNFGDGSAVFSSTAPTVGFTYRRKGSFAATLAVIDANGRSTITTRTVVVQ